MLLRSATAASSCGVSGLAGDDIVPAGGRPGNRCQGGRQVGCVGGDDFGTTLRRGLSDEGIDARHVEIVPSDGSALE